MEKWLDINNYVGLYQVSNFGNIIRCLNKKAKTTKGYMWDVDDKDETIKQLSNG